MKRRVQISELKAKLSAYLHVVRKGGELVVMDRKTPVARVLPYEDSPHELTIRMPRPGSPRPCDIPMPPPIPGLPDIVEFLRREREEEG
jgi:prevent-host-death family protein